MADLIDDTALTEIEQRAAAATPPSEGSTSWIVAKNSSYEIYTGPLADDSQDIASWIFHEADAAFIAAARTDVPALVAALRVERDKTRRVRELIEQQRQAWTRNGYDMSNGVMLLEVDILHALEAPDAR